MGTRGYWEASLATVEAEASGAPFAPGDRVLLRRDPYHSWIVERVEPHPRGGFTIYIGVGNVVEIGPTNELIAAPDGWEDAPAMPTGSIAHGLSERDRQAKIEHDEASPLYRADMRLWHCASIAWLTRWRETIAPLIGEEQVEQGIAFHRGRLAGMSEWFELAPKAAP
jgi:hypothetical protein